MFKKFSVALLIVSFVNMSFAKCEHVHNVQAILPVTVEVPAPAQVEVTVKHGIIAKAKDAASYVKDTVSSAATTAWDSTVSAGKAVGDTAKSVGNMAVNVGKSAVAGTKDAAIYTIDTVDAAARKVPAPVYGVAAATAAVGLLYTYNECFRAAVRDMLGLPKEAKTTVAVTVEKVRTR